jgi:hypothetical protein
MLCKHSFIFKMDTSVYSLGVISFFFFFFVIQKELDRHR